MQPLTPALQAEAKAAIAKVGTTPTTCVPPVVTPTDPSGSGGGSGGGFGSGGLGSSTDFASSPSVGTSSSSDSGAAAAAAADAELAAASTDIPGWAGGSLPSTLLAAVALLGPRAAHRLHGQRHLGPTVERPTPLPGTSVRRPTGRPGERTIGRIVVTVTTEATDDAGPEPETRDRPPAELGDPEPDEAPAHSSREPEVGPVEPMSGRRIALLASLWLVMTLVCLALVVYAVEPIFVHQTQDELLATYRTQIDKATKETQGLPATTGTAKAPPPGAPVAILEIGALSLQQVVVEGVSSSQTQAGPGHVPGTAGAGQPGNSAIVGRRGAFGGPFADLGHLQPDDTILVTTTQGQVRLPGDLGGGEEHHEAVGRRPGRCVGVSPRPTDAAGDDSSVEVDSLLGSSDDDRLTLITSASDLPWSSSEATVVTATMDGKPFVPTAAGRPHRRPVGDVGRPLGLGAVPPRRARLRGGRHRGRAPLPPLVDAGRYLLTTPALVAFVILAAESGSRLLPAWM